MTAPNPNDRGADGPAALARPRRIMEWQRRITPTRTVTERREVMADVLLIDRMHQAGQLSDRQHNAACRLHGLFVAAGLVPRSTQRVDTLREELDDTLDAPEEMDPPEEARLVYRRLIVSLGRPGELLDAMMYEDHPCWALEVAQDGLDDLADQWGMEKN